MCCLPRPFGKPSHVSSFMEGSQRKQHEEQTINKQEKEKVENPDSVFTFGDDLDVPAFIRNRQNS